MRIVFVIVAVSIGCVTMVNKALLELKMEVSEDMRALIMVANMTPRAPIGMSSMTSLGNTILEQPLALPHIALHSLGELQPTSSLLKDQLIFFCFFF